MRSLAARRRRNRHRNWRRKWQCQRTYDFEINYLLEKARREAFNIRGTSDMYSTINCNGRRGKHTHFIEVSYTRNQYGGLDYEDCIVDGERLYGRLVI